MARLLYSRSGAVTLQQRAKKAPSVRGCLGRDLLRRAGGDDLTATRAAFRAQIDDPVCGLDHIQVVLNDDDGVAVVAQPMQYVEQLLNVRKVQAGGGLIENVERLAGVALGDSVRYILH